MTLVLEQRKCSPENVDAVLGEWHGARLYSLKLRGEYDLPMAGIWDAIIECFKLNPSVFGRNLDALEEMFADVLETRPNFVLLIELGANCDEVLRHFCQSFHSIVHDVFADFLKGNQIQVSEVLVLWIVPELNSSTPHFLANLPVE